jgi:pimeloyl-ACP methyl ester carboxylesterase
VKRRAASLGHVLLCHGNAGNVGDRVALAALLSDAGFDVLVFDYRGYGHSSGRPSERGTYRDARAALASLLRQPGVDATRVLYLGESLGGAVALELALAHPPEGLALISAFTSVRAMARMHYSLIPTALVPDAYPSLCLIAGLRAPLLVLHGEDDVIVPADQGRALFEAAPEPKELRIVPGVGHNDIVSLGGNRLVEEIAAWAA